MPKGWIIFGHNMSEESGMQEIADWLRPIVPEVKVLHVRAAGLCSSTDDANGQTATAVRLDAPRISIA